MGVVIKVQAASEGEVEFRNMRILNYERFLDDYHSLPCSEADVPRGDVRLQLLVTSLLQEEHVQVLPYDVVPDTVDFGLPLEVVLVVPLFELLRVPLDVVTLEGGPVDLPVERRQKCLVHHPVETPEQVDGFLGGSEMLNNLLILFENGVPNGKVFVFG